MSEVELERLLGKIEEELKYSDSVTFRQAGKDRYSFTSAKIPEVREYLNNRGYNLKVEVVLSNNSLTSINAPFIRRYNFKITKQSAGRSSESTELVDVEEFEESVEIKETEGVY